MSDLTAKFADLQDQLATQAATMGAYVDTVEAKLQLVNDNLSIIEENMAANTKMLLAALGQTGACFPCPTPSTTVPPITTTPVTTTTAICQRAQAIIATIHNILASFDTLQSFNVVGTFNVLNDAISEVISAIAAGDTVPLPSFPEAVNIVGDYIAYAGERVFSGVGLVEQFSPVEADLVNGIWSASDASAAESQYAAIIDASSISNQGKLLIKAVAYNALWSYYYDTGTSPDVSGFDGSACGITGCDTVSSALTSINGGAAISFVEWTSPYLPVNTVGGVTSDHFTWATRDFTGWTFTPSVDVHFYILFGDGGNFAAAGVPITLGSDVSLFTMRRNDSGTGAFTVLMCPPS